MEPQIIYLARILLFATKRENCAKPDKIPRHSWGSQQFRLLQLSLQLTIISQNNISMKSEYSLCLLWILCILLTMPCYIYKQKMSSTWAITHGGRSIPVGYSLGQSLVHHKSLWSSDHSIVQFWHIPSNEEIKSTLFHIWCFCIRMTSYTVTASNPKNELHNKLLVSDQISKRFHGMDNDNRFGDLQVRINRKFYVKLRH